MSSMRNAVARRPHRERAQPLERRRLGLLEKHKDYTLRAKDFGKKKAQLKSLRQKAADRNEDEFYFGMMSRKGPGSRIQNGKRWDGTVEGDRGNKALSVETVRLLKTQDIGYIRTMRQVLVKEIARLEQQVVLTRGLDRLDDDDDDDDGADDEDNDLSDDDMPMPSRPKAARKIVFLDDEEERQGTMLERLEAEQEDHEEEEENNAPGRDKDQEENDEEFERAKNLRRLKRQLANAKMKVQAFNDAEAALDVQRAKMAKTATSGGQSRRGKKLFVRARKR
ncbi:Small subunit (SSU) processome component [Claviceps sp. LM77 group G4]|nr:Small subunit (SSU) processome component [Claviceps sp. LM77 group G4]KAG6070365.1 Small subunit (SSU) processome component [Claviceps sp. LM78 group G4]KAG6084758.1 Small subunit (SSU) processome component [Claviceps sp. LM84 group G4]